MTIEQIRAAYLAKPFRPFIIHLADGRQLPVLSPEFMLTVPSGRTIAVSQPDDSVNIVDLFTILSLTKSEP